MSQPSHNVYYMRLFESKNDTAKKLRELAQQGWVIISSTLGDEYDNILLEKKERNPYAGL